MALNCLFTYRKVTKLFQSNKFGLLRYYNSIHHAAYFHKCSSWRNKQQVEEYDVKDESDSESNGKTNDFTDTKLQILHSSLDFVPDHGWTKKSIAFGAQSLGLSSAVHTLIPDGEYELVHYFNFTCNENLNSYLQKQFSTNTEKKNLQEYMENALEYRLRMIIPFVNHWSEEIMLVIESFVAMSLMVNPTQIRTDLINLYDLVDIVWHHSGFKSIDETWYSKRISLAVAYKSCELSLVQDKSQDFIDTFDFLQRRVANVLNTDTFVKEIFSGSKQLPNNISGALITVRNILGANKLFR